MNMHYTGGLLNISIREKPGARLNLINWLNIIEILLKIKHTSIDRTPSCSQLFQGRSLCELNKSLVQLNPKHQQQNTVRLLKRSADL